MKKETERLNTLVDWYKFKLDEIREAPVDSRPRKMSQLYQISDLGLTITRAGTINPENYPGYPPELKFQGSLPAGCKEYNQLDYFRQIIRAYQG